MTITVLGTFIVISIVVVVVVVVTFFFFFFLAFVEGEDAQDSGGADTLPLPPEHRTVAHEAAPAELGTGTATATAR